MGKKQIQKALNIFAKRVKEKINPEKILLWGSYARGEANEYSDVDIIVISEKFAKISKEKRFDILYNLTRGLQPDFHVYGFTKDELDKTSPLTTLSEVKKYGILLSV